MEKREEGRKEGETGEEWTPRETLKPTLGYLGPQSVAPSPSLNVTVSFPPATWGLKSRDVGGERQDLYLDGGRTCSILAEITLGVSRLRSATH